MKTFTPFLFLCCSLFLTHNSSAEEDSLITRFDRGYKHSIGIYSTGIVRIFLGPTKNFSPYRLVYRYNMGLNSIRVGFKSNFDLYSKKTDDSLNTTGDGGYSFRIGAGYEWYKPFSNKRFSFYYGGELNVYKMKTRNYKQTPLLYTNQIENKINLGIAPFAGIEVSLIKHISISAELMLNGGYRFHTTKKEEKILSTNSTEETVIRNNGTFVHLSLPRAISLRINF